MPSTPALKAIPRGIWVLGFVSLLMDLSSELIHSLLPVFMVTTLGSSALVVGLIEGAGEGTALIVKVFAGAWSDYWGRRKPLALLGYGLGAASKPLFALAASAGLVLAARLVDRVGKGLRGAPRDAMVADLAPPEVRGAAFGLRQALDTVGAFAGPALALVLMLSWHDDFRAVFQVAIIPGLLSVALLLFGVREPPTARPHQRRNPLSRTSLARLSPAYWRVVAIGTVFTLARFSEAFLILRAQQGGLPLFLTPLVLIAMNLVYAASAYPFGELSDRLGAERLLRWGVVALIGADLALACGNRGGALWSGIALWGLHMGMTQGLLARMIADTAPADLRGTAYGMFNLLGGIALLLASALAGLLWDRFGAPRTFEAGLILAILAVAATLLPRRQPAA